FRQPGSRSVISPVLFAIGVSLDHALGSKWLLESFARLGYSISYDEVNIHKQSVVQNVNQDLPQAFLCNFKPWSGDNVDHNVVTIDGAGIFHRMGIISMSTTSNKLGTDIHLETHVPRYHRVNVLNLVKNFSTYMHLPYHTICLTNLYLYAFQTYCTFKFCLCLATLFKWDLVWHADLISM